MYSATDVQRQRLSTVIVIEDVLPETSVQGESHVSKELSELSWDWAHLKCFCVPASLIWARRVSQH